MKRSKMYECRITKLQAIGYWLEMQRRKRISWSDYVDYLAGHMIYIE